MLLRHHLFKCSSERGFLEEKQFVGDPLISFKVKHLWVIIHRTQTSESNLSSR